jgi:hypothetical protein
MKMFEYISFTISLLSNMKLTLRNKTFTIITAKLSAMMPDPYWTRTYNPNGNNRLFWSLHISAENKTEADIQWPGIYHENLHFPIRSWKDVAGQVVEWSERYDQESGEPNGGFYVFEHADIPRARLEFVERDVNRFKFEWEGVCDVFWDEEFWQEVPFSATGWADFTEIIVNGSELDTPESPLERLSEYLDVNDFIQEPLLLDHSCYQSGIKMNQTRFSPIVE